MRNLIKCLKDKQGTTMIEVLVAVIVVLLVTATFSNVISASTKMLSSSMDIIAETESFNKEYYRTEKYEHRKQTTGRLSLSVDMDKTKDVTAEGKTLALNEKSEIVYWDEPSGYDMYAVNVGHYANSLVPVPPDSGSGETDEPDPTPPTEETDPPTETTPPIETDPPTDDDGNYIEVEVEDTLSKIYECNDWDTKSKELRDEAINNHGTHDPEYVNWNWRGGMGEVYIIINKEGKKEGWISIEYYDVNFAGTEDISKEHFVDRIRNGQFVKITDDTKVFTSEDLYNGQHQGEKVFKAPCPKKGELFYDGTNYYVARCDIPENQPNYTRFNGDSLVAGAWVKLLQPTQPSE